MASGDARADIDSSSSNGGGSSGEYRLEIDELECPQVVYTALYASGVALASVVFTQGYVSALLTRTLDALVLAENVTATTTTAES